MNITLSPDLERRVAERVKWGDVADTESFVEQALTFYLDYDAAVMDEEELRETRAAIDEARNHSLRGEAVPAEDVRNRKDVPRSEHSSLYPTPCDNCFMENIHTCTRFTTTFRATPWKSCTSAMAPERRCAAVN